MRNHPLFLQLWSHWLREALWLHKGLLFFRSFQIISSNKWYSETSVRFWSSDIQELRVLGTVLGFLLVKLTLNCQKRALKTEVEIEYEGQDCCKRRQGQGQRRIIISNWAETVSSMVEAGKPKRNWYIRSSEGTVDRSFTSLRHSLMPKPSRNWYLI